MAEDESIQNSDGDTEGTLPIGAPKLIRDILDEAADYATSTQDGTIDAGPRLTIDAEAADLSRLVRVDKVGIALFLFAAHFALRDQSNVLRRALAGFLTFLGVQGSLQGGKFIAKKLGWRAIPGVNVIVGIFNQIETLFESHAENNALIMALRSRSRYWRQDLVKSSLPTNPRRVRKTKLVYSRHPSPRQRRPNKSWRSPKT